MATTASSAATKAIYGSLTKSPLFKRAILSVEGQFSDVVVEPSLKKWCESDAFNQILNSFKEGNRPPIEAEIISSYIEIGEFYSAENTECDAQKVLISFFSYLEHEMYVSTEGSAALAKRNEVLHEQTRAEFEQKLTPVETHLLDLKASVSHIQASISDKSISSQDFEEKIYHTRINEAHKLIKKGKCTVALTMLSQLREDTVNKNVSKSVLYRLATNLGYCNHVLDSIKIAQEEFELAYRLEPGNAQAVSNLSAMKLERGYADDALDLIQKSGKIAQSEPALVANYLTALLMLRKEDDFANLMRKEAWILDNSDCCFAIGNRRFEEDKYQEAEQFLRKANTLAKDAEPRIMVLLAHCLIRPTQRALQDQPILRSQFPESFQATLLEANQLLTNVIDLLMATDDSKVLVNAFVLRADVRRMQGDMKGAAQDCDLALSRNKNEIHATQLKGICCLHEKRIDEAIQLLEPLHTSQSPLSLTFPIAVGLACAEKHEKICQLLEPILQDRIPSQKHIKLCDFLLTAYIALSKHTEAQSLVDRLIEQFPNKPETLVILSHYLMVKGKTKEAENALIEALSYSDDNIRPFIALELADFYYSKDDFAKAANLYDSIANVFSGESMISHRYLSCLYHSGSYAEALALARKIRNNAEPIAFVSQIEAKILIAFGDLKTALQILEALSLRFPKIHAYQIEAAQCAYRLVRYEQARRLLSSVDFEEIRGDSRLLMMVARLRSLLGMDNVLKFAYEARRLGYSSPEIHAVYCMLSVNQEGKETPSLACEASGVDCSITLHTADGVITYTILDASDIRPEYGEISIQDANKMRLMGRRVGDEILLRKNVWQEIKGEVREIKSKYVWAFQETLAKFSTSFPTSALIQPVRGDYEQFREGFFRQLDYNQEHTKKVIAVYEGGQITIEYLSELLATPLTKTWGILVGGNYTKLLSDTGTVDDISRDFMNANKATSVVLELTSVLTLAALGILERIPMRFKDIYCTQDVIDALSQSIAEYSSGKPALVIGKIGDNYVKDEASPEDVQRRRVYYEGILEFLVSKCKIAPFISDAKETQPNARELKKILGPISASSVLAARNLKAFLVSEDAMLRILARNEWNVLSGWTQTLLWELKLTKTLSENEYCDCIVKLVLLNYNFVSINSDVIMWLFTKTNFKFENQIKKVFEFFYGPTCSVESAALVLADVIKRVWLERLLYETKLQILDEVLVTMSRGRPLKESIDIWLLLMKSKFLFLPSAAIAIEKYAASWKQRQFSKVGL